MLLDAAEAVLALEPDWSAAAGLDIGVVGPYPEGSGGGGGPRLLPGIGIAEDPVTGSLNAGSAQWLAGGRLPTSYVASQGTVLGRRGRVPHRPRGRHGLGGRRRATTIAGTSRLGE